MALPEYIRQRSVSVGGAYVLESGQPLGLRLVLVSSKSLIRQENGFRFERDSVQTISTEAGTAIELDLPVTDQDLWIDAATGMAIDVTAEGSYTHRYTGMLTIMTESGRVLRSVTLGPFVLPAGDGTVVDLDVTLPVSSTPGEQVFVPDMWSQFAPEAAASANAARLSAADAYTSAVHAGNSEVNAASSEDAAFLSKNQSKDAADVASAAMQGAVQASSDALASERDAADSEGRAASHADRASLSEGQASTSASTATREATAASSSADSADLNAEAALGAKADATVARTGAEAARTGAETARTGSETARTGAEAARDASLAGQFAGTVLYSATHLDTVQTPGVYRSGSNYGPSNGYPVTSVGILEVYQVTPTRVHQRYTVVAAGPGMKGVYQRRLDAGAWSVWHFLPSQRINAVAGNPNVEVLTWDDVNAREQAMMTAGVSLAASTDLNALVTPGVYKQNAGGSLALGFPLDNFFGVIVVYTRASGGAIQIAYKHNALGNDSKRFYMRGQSGSSWSSWNVFGSLRAAATAGQPGPEVFMWDDANQREQQLASTGILIGTVNLNAITVSGTYVQPSSGNVTLAAGYPVVGVQGVLEVFNTTNTVLQRYTQTPNFPTAVRAIYQRRYIFSTGLWSAWSTLPTQRVDQTAGRAIYTWDDLNNREQLVYGDTGLRNISALLTTYPLTQGACVIRRVGSLVQMSFDNALGPGGTEPNFIPAGFRTALASVMSTPYGNITVWPGGGNMNYPAFSGASSRYCHLSWFTNDPWPTTLPGIAHGSAGIPSN